MADDAPTPRPERRPRRTEVPARGPEPPHRAWDDRGPQGTIEHPNRTTTASKLVRALVTLLLVISAALLLVVFIGGYAVVKAMAIVAVVYILLYLIVAFLVLRWQRGMLPVAAGMATIVGINLLVAIPAWSDRHAVGYTIDTASPALLATVCAVFVVLQVVLIVLALYGFRQNWHVEIERMPDGTTRRSARVA